MKDSIASKTRLHRLVMCGAAAAEEAVVLGIPQSHIGTALHSHIGSCASGSGTSLSPIAESLRKKVCGKSLRKKVCGQSPLAANGSANIGALATGKD